MGIQTTVAFAELERKKIHYTVETDIDFHYGESEDGHAVEEQLSIKTVRIHLYPNITVTLPYVGETSASSDDREGTISQLLTIYRIAHTSG